MLIISTATRYLIKCTTSLSAMAAHVAHTNCWRTQSSIFGNLQCLHVPIRLLRTHLQHQLLPQRTQGMHWTCQIGALTLATLMGSSAVVLTSPEAHLGLLLLADPRSLCAGARSICVDAVPSSQPTQDSKLSPWSLYDEPELYDRAFGEREFDEEVSDPCLKFSVLHCLAALQKLTHPWSPG